MSPWIAYALGVVTPLAISGAVLAFLFWVDLHYHTQVQLTHTTSRGEHYHAFRGSMPRWWRTHVAMPQSEIACDWGSRVPMGRDIQRPHEGYRTTYTNTEEDPLWPRP